MSGYQKWLGSSTLVGISCVLLSSISSVHSAQIVTPRVDLHYSANGNFDRHSHFLPGKAGFNVADVSTASQLDTLPDGVHALVWIGQCGGVDASFEHAMESYLGKPKVFGYYLMDDPDPRGVPSILTSSPRCEAENLKAESDWIHLRAPGAKTFVVLMNMSSSESPSYKNTYNWENSHVDLFGLAAYPCRSTVIRCDYNIINRYVAAAEAAGIPRKNIVPIFQTFGGGKWVTDGDGHYQLPTASEEKKIIRRWGQLIATPVFDFAYSWGSQNSDLSLGQDLGLQAVMRNHNEARAPKGP